MTGGVDSGQAGIFDDSKYPDTDEERGEYGDNDRFYGKCCNKTMNNEGCGVFDGCFVSSSGYGDGSYNCYIAEKDNEIIGIAIQFIDED